MASEFQEAAALYLSVLGMRDHVLNMFRENLAQLEQAQLAVDNQHPSANPDMVEGFTQQTAMYRSDMEVINTIYSVARSEVVDILNEKREAQEAAGAGAAEETPAEQ